MAYTINKTDGNILTSVEDGILNSDTSLQLIGRNSVIPCINDSINISITFIKINSN